MKKIFLENKKTFVLYICIIIAIFMASSYYYFLNNYIKLENERNNQYLQYLLGKINAQYKLFNNDFSTVRKIANSYDYLIKDPSYINFFDSLTYMQTLPSNQKVTQTLHSVYFGKILIKTKKNDQLINLIEVFDKNNNYLFSIKTSNERQLFNAGQKTISLFLVMVIIFIIALYMLAQKYYDAIKNNNERLEKEVVRRTSQIQSTLIELEKANLKLYDMAHTDFLTKIRNRRNFFIHAQNYFDNAIKKNNDFCIILIDIDNFKPFNDTYGHDIGDKVLIAFTKCVQACLDEKNIFGRLGGEEFAIAFYNISLHEVLQKAETIRSAVENLEISTREKTLKMTASFGVSDIRGCKDLDQVIHKADSMLYSAKHNGKNRVRSRLSNFK